MRILHSPGSGKLTPRIKAQLVTLLLRRDIATTMRNSIRRSENLLTDERRVRHRVRVERARVAYVVGLLAPFRQLHLYYVFVPSVEHDAYVSVLAEKEQKS